MLSTLNILKLLFISTAFGYKTIPFRQNNSVNQHHKSQKPLLQNQKTYPLLDVGPLKNAIAVCPVEPEYNNEYFDQEHLRQTVLKKTIITSASTVVLAALLPPVKELGLKGTMSINTNIVKSAKAIAPIVMFTVNAPPILNTLFNKVPFLKSTNSEFRIALLAIIKHLWIWGPENKLNDISTGQPSQTIQPLKEIIVRRTAHTAREGILISLISKNHCDTQLEKFKSIFIMAIMQTVFDRLSFKTNLNVLFTLMSRFLYLLLVKEVIEQATRITSRYLNR